MVREAALGEISDGGLARRLRGPPLDAVDDGGGLAPAFIGRHLCNRPQGHLLQAGRPLDWMM